MNERVANYLLIGRSKRYIVLNKWIWAWLCQQWPDINIMAWIDDQSQYNVLIWKEWLGMCKLMTLSWRGDEDMMRWSRIPAWDQSDSELELDFSLNSSHKFINLCGGTQSKTTGVKTTNEKSGLFPTDAVWDWLWLPVRNHPGPGKQETLDDCWKRQTDMKTELTTAGSSGLLTRRLLYRVCGSSIIPATNRVRVLTGRWSRVFLHFYRSDSHLCDHSTANICCFSYKERRQESSTSNVPHNIQTTAAVYFFASILFKCVL